MMLFWIFSAAMLAAVLALLLRPLLAPASELHDTTAASNLRVLRAQLLELDNELALGTLTPEQHAAARAEVERRVLEEAQSAPVVAGGRRGGKATAVLVALAVPALAVPLYLHLGAREALDPAFVQRANQGEDHAGMDMETAVARLAERMKADPSDPTGWALLGRSYAQMGRYVESRDAYKEAVARVPLTAEPIQVQLDDSMAMTPAMKLSAFPQVVVAARISKSGAGGANPQPGDLEGESAPMASSGEVRLAIDRVRQ